MKRNIMSLVNVIAFLLLTACEHKELCEVHPHVKTIRVVFDWQDAPDANPEGMCVYFYPQDDMTRTAPIRFDFLGDSGGKINLQVGKYQVICLNNDTESVLYRGVNNYYTHEAYTREGNVLEPIYGNGAYSKPKIKNNKYGEEERVIISPDMLWGCAITELEITDDMEPVLTLYPHEMVCTYTYEIRNVKNLNLVNQMCGSISGMASSLFIGTQEPGRENITIPFDATSDGESTIKGRFYTFGHLDEENLSQRMTFYFWMKNGEKFIYGNNGEKFDVTEQIQNAPNKKKVHIIVDGLDLPIPMAEENGFKPSVDDWQEVNVDINM